MVTQAVEDYLKAIYDIQHEQREEWATTTALAQKMGVTAASVTEMLKRMSADLDLVFYERYRGAQLTPEGEKAALEVIRHHRLLETFLSETLGYRWDEVHEEAHRLEHVISEDMEERIAEFLGQPERDPHGSPIPDRDGTMLVPADIRLTELPEGQAARIQRVSDDDPALLRYLAEIGLTPDTAIEVTARTPFDGPQHVQLIETGTTHALGQQVTDRVYVVVITG